MEDRTSSNSSSDDVGEDDNDDEFIKKKTSNKAIKSDHVNLPVLFESDDDLDIILATPESR